MSAILMIDFDFVRLFRLWFFEREEKREGERAKRGLRDIATKTADIKAMKINEDAWLFYCSV